MRLGFSVAEEAEGSASHDDFRIGRHLRKGILEVLRIHDLAPVAAAGCFGEGELDAFVGSIDEDQEGVVDDGIAFLVGNRQGLSIEQEGDASTPAGVPDFIGHLASVGVEPGDIVNDRELIFAANDTILKKLSAMEIGMAQAEMNELAREVKQALARRIELPVEPG